MLRLRFCDYSDTDIVVKRTITVRNNATAGAPENNANKKATFKNCAPFTSCR